MKTIDVYYGDVLAGQLSKMPDKTYEFAYNKSYLASRNNPAISLSFPKRAEPYRSAVLFPFFNNLLPEGANRRTLCRMHRVDEKDYFGMMEMICDMDCIGNVTLKKTNGNGKAKGMSL